MHCRQTLTLTLISCCLTGHAALAHHAGYSGSQWQPASPIAPITPTANGRPFTAAGLLERLIGNAEAKSSTRIDEQAGFRYIDSDGLPQHRTGNFPNRNNPHRIRSQNYRFRMPLQPTQGNRTAVPRYVFFGVALNGVPFDPATAEFWNNDRSSGWAAEAIGGPRKLGLDDNNAHVQPNGAYHYHGIPTGLLAASKARGAFILIGYAADGFPVYVDKTGLTRPSYRLKQGARRGHGPGGRYDGGYTQDWTFQSGLGDLDRCNGKQITSREYPQGSYAYFLTERFPFIPRCWQSRPDSSFYKQRSPGGHPADARPQSSAPSNPHGQGDAEPNSPPNFGTPGESRRVTQPATPPEPGEMRRPPAAAVDACRDKQSTDPCRVETPHGTLGGLCREVPTGDMACVPDYHRRPR